MLAKKRIQAFTLIELMITVVIVGILAKIAVASYFSAIQRSRLAVAKGIVLEAAQLLERSYALNNSYPSDIPAALKQSPKVGDGSIAYFTIDYSVGTSNGSYRLRATVNSPYAASDCQTLIYVSTGQKFAYTAANVAITTNSTSTTVDSDCWNR